MALILQYEQLRLGVLKSGSNVHQRDGVNRVVIPLSLRDPGPSLLVVYSNQRAPDESLVVTTRP